MLNQIRNLQLFTCMSFGFWWRVVSFTISSHLSIEEAMNFRVYLFCGLSLIFYIFGILWINLKQLGRFLIVCKFSDYSFLKRIELNIFYDDLSQESKTLCISISLNIWMFVNLYFMSNKHMNTETVSRGYLR